MTDSKDDKRDEVLKRMLATPPKPKDAKTKEEGEGKVKIRILSFLGRLIWITFRIDGIAYGAPVDTKKYTS